MAYELVISERTERQIDECVRYIADILRNPYAAGAVLDDISEVYDFLESAPETFCLCEDPYLSAKGYRKISLRKHNYIFIYRIEGKTVCLAGFFMCLRTGRQKYRSVIRTQLEK